MIRKISAEYKPTEPHGDDQNIWHLDENIVVTQDRDGNAASHFYQDAWNIETYGSNTSLKNLLFRDFSEKNTKNDLRNLVKYEIKRIMFHLMHDANDAMPAVSTLHHFLSELKKLSKYATGKGKSLNDVIANAAEVLHYVSQPRKARSAIRLHSIFVHLHSLGKQRTGIEIPLRELHAPLVQRYGDTPRPQQHPLIPARIYQHILSICEEELTMIEDELDELQEIYKYALNGKQIRKRPYSTNKIFSHFGRARNRRGFSLLLADIGLLCQMIIMGFTGMRIHEAETLPFKCLTHFTVDGIEHIAIEGITTKLSDGRPKRALWITSHLGARAVRVIQRLFGEVHKKFATGDYTESTSGEYLLFCNPCMGKSVYQKFRGRQFSQYFDEFRLRVCPRIIKDDIRELEFVDPHRSWATESKFSAGEIWPFTPHQLRRSLAIYAHNSGIVTLPSLKRQLQHITLEMSLYYAKGSAFARNLLTLHKDHFVKDWGLAQRLSEYLGYAKQVIYSDEKLFGGHAAWVNSSAVKQSPVSIYSRGEAEKMFKKGQIAYRETPLGGCTKVNRCESSPINLLPVECIENNCKHLIASPRKLKRVIAAQNNRVTSLEKISKESVEYRIESHILQKLLTMEGRAKKS